MWDFELLTMQFQFEDHTITFNGLNPTGLSLEEGHQFLKGSTSSIKDVLLLLYVYKYTQSSNPILKPLRSIVHEFQSIFAKPKGLPPPRSHDHQILLKFTQPISFHPYRYPYY